MRLFLFFTLTLLSACAPKRMVVSMEDYQGVPENGYVKDVNNHLDKYVGKWINEQNGNLTELHIKKKTLKIYEKYQKKTFFIDALVVKHKISRISDGKIIENTLSLKDDTVGEISLKSMGFGLQIPDLIFFYIGKCGVGSTTIRTKLVNRNLFYWQFNPLITDAQRKQFQGKDVEVRLPVGNKVMFRRK